jgi:hypothetical protein
MIGQAGKWKDGRKEGEAGRSGHGRDGGREERK